MGSGGEARARDGIDKLCGACCIAGGIEEGISVASIMVCCIVAGISEGALVVGIIVVGVVVADSCELSCWIGAGINEGACVVGIIICGPKRICTERGSFCMSLTVDACPGCICTD
jgi:hypothetical protein